MDITPFLRGAIAKYSLTSKAYSNLRTITYGIFKYAKEKGYITWSISQTIGDMELPRKAFHKVIKEDDEEVFNDEEMAKLIKEISLKPDLLNVPTEFSSILSRLKLMSESEEYIFWKGNKNITASQVRKRLYILCDRIDIKRKSPHKLRKTYVSILLDNGVDKRLVQDVAGHTEIATSERNYHRNRKSDQKKEAILSNLPEFKDMKVMF